MGGVTVGRGGTVRPSRLLSSLTKSFKCGNLVGLVDGRWVCGGHKVGKWKEVAWFDILRVPDFSQGDPLNRHAVD